MIDHRRRLLDRPESAQTAAERPIPNTHTLIENVRRRLSHRLLSLTHLHYAASDL